MKQINKFIASLCISSSISFISRHLLFSILHFLLLFSSNLVPFFHNLVFCSFFSVFCWKVLLEQYYDKNNSFVLNFYFFFEFKSQTSQIFEPLSCFFYRFWMGEFFIPSHQNWQIFEPSNFPVMHLGQMNFLSAFIKTDKFFFLNPASFTDFRLEFQLINLLTLP